MLNLLLVIAVVLWFALLYPLARHRLETRMGPLNGPMAIPFVLMTVFALLPLVFNVPRDDGNAVLDQGLTASNLALIIMTGLTGLYLALRIAVDRRVLLVAFSMPYLPFTLMIVVNGLSTAWSIVPTYTAYRTVELAIFTLASIMIFDRSDIERRLANLFALFTVAWLAATAPIILDNLRQGIVFSSAKHNLMPYLCAAHAFLVIFDDRIRHRGAHLLLASAGFVIAGSAASTASLVAAVPGLMVASRHRRLRVLGYAGFAVYLTLFLVLMGGLSAFPALLDVISTVLQKPPEELADATGRGTFWPVFIEATKDRFVGAGYAAGDRFIQLLIPTTSLAETLARDAVFISSSHNMLLSAWAGTGVIGIGLVAMVLGTAMRWGMRLDRAGRRLIATCVFFLTLNGMTTPGIFQDWNINLLTFLGLLAYARIGALRRAPSEATAPVVEVTPFDLGRPAPGWRPRGAHRSAFPGAHLGA